ncbi:hypothetical protein ACFVVM_33025 [Nocardia sp. NPDC058176]|uniref:hypothetical protein n=1 Tax=Nocardia sp. NPDC058176 TaxID=3346368 RepID=UPI0036DC0E2C
MSQQNSSESGTAAVVRDKPPYRIVDARNVGWIVQGGTDQYRSFDPSVAGEPEMSTATLAEITAAHGPVRPVVVRPTDDSDALRAAFDGAGRKTITSIASAVEVVHFEARNRFGPWDSDVSATAAYAERTLIAGRPGSWESARLSDLWLFGSELNLWRRDNRASLAEMRASGPNPKRVDVVARDRIAEVLRRWTGDPECYVEVAENLSGIVSGYADDRYGDQGWKHIADQWLQPDARLPSAAAESLYRLLYSKSAYFRW